MTAGLLGEVIGAKNWVDCNTAPDVDSLFGDPPVNSGLAPLTNNAINLVPVERINIPGGSAGTKIQVMLDTKANNWAHWSRHMMYLFNAVEVRSIVTGQNVCLDPVHDA